MITLNNLSKHYAKKILFQDISLNINRGEKIGLIGPNGAGKTTLFSIILGETESSSGTIKIHKGVHIGYLPQEFRFSSWRTVLAELTEGDKRILDLRAQLKKLEEANQSATHQYGEIQHKLEVYGAFELEHKAKRILSGLGFRESDFNRPINSLSGGWQMRTLLAKLLVYQYDLLLLDEPTNYLDLNATIWLKSYLASLEATFIIISHDKVFLSDVTNYTLILENSRVFKVKGNYDHYERVKQENIAALQKQLKEQQKKIEQFETFISRFHAQPNKAASVRAKRTQLERLKANIIELPRERKNILNFEFPATSRSGHKTIALKEISKSYGDLKVYENLNFEIVRGEKAVLAGENGAGKSTLLKILAGAIDFNSGERILGHNVEVGYFSQTRMDVLNPQKTVLEDAYSAAPYNISQEKIRTLLGVFLFSGDDVNKQVSVLSGGEKTRLILAKLLLNPPNFILLDEPTTHLDIEGVEALVAAFKAYDGTLVFISHDIYFVKEVANTVFEVKDGRVRRYAGGFDYYLEKKARGEEPLDIEVRQQITVKDKTPPKPEKAIKEEDAVRIRVNQEIFQKINFLKKEKEKLQLEHYAKARAINNKGVYRTEEEIQAYKLRLAQIEKRSAEIDQEISVLRKQKVRKKPLK